MFTATIRRIAALAVAPVIALGAFGCSKTVRDGRSPAYLIVDSVQAAQGNNQGQFSGELSSDVITKNTFYEDLGQATFSLGLKNIGSSTSTASPTQNNFITISRYHVAYRRTDGRNTPGVDVPYAFDGAGTATVSDSGGTLVFVLVRAQAKEEPPLANLQGLGGANLISTVADVTFYGKDQTGNDVAVTASISVNFADWGDPQ
jgi:hypothetical protein